MEIGEEERSALIRECQEELGVRVEVTQRVGADIEFPGGRALLRVYLARIRNGDQPQTLEHSQLRWLGADELNTVEWLPADAPIVEALPPLLARQA